MESLSPKETDGPYVAISLEQGSLRGVRARKYAQINVEAIRAVQGPDVLLYAKQLARPAESWTAEFRGDEKLYCWICVAPHPKTGSCSLEHGQWVGMIKLHGPLSQDQYNFFRDKTSEQEYRTDQETTTRWIGGRLYVKPHHRNVQALRALQDAWTTFIREQTSEAAEATAAQVQVTAYYGTPAHEGHKASGLKVLRELTRVEDLAYDGLLDAVPDGMLQDFHKSRLIGTLFEMIT